MNSVMTKDWRDPDFSFKRILQSFAVPLGLFLVESGFSILFPYHKHIFMSSAILLTYVVFGFFYDRNIGSKFVTIMWMTGDALSDITPKCQESWIVDMLMKVSLLAIGYGLSRLIRWIANKHSVSSEQRTDLNRQ